MKDRKKGQRVQSVERALLLLEILSDMGKPVTLSELTEKANLNISTVHRLLQTLMFHHFVEQDLNTGRYRLGLRVFEIGSSALYNLDIRDISKPYLEQLVEQCNETANIAILEQGELVYIQQVESTYMMKMFARVGNRGPAYCTAAGKVLLAYLEEEKLINIILKTKFIKFTDKTITDPEELKEELVYIRKRGYSLDVEEMEEGVKCIAFPVMNHEGRVVAAVSISGPMSRMTDKRLKDTLLINLRETALKISLDLGYKNMPPEKSINVPRSVVE